MTHESIKKKVEAEINASTYIGDIRIYKFVLDLLDNECTLADDFMLSNEGGYTLAQLNQIKNYIIRDKRKYMQKLKSGLQAF